MAGHFGHNPNYGRPDSVTRVRSPSKFMSREDPADDDDEEHGLTTAEIVANQSQDYIDEKELEYLQTIQQLADEQERVQKKTFVNWINAYLAQRIPPLRVNNLIEDMKDGTRLIALLEVISGEKLPLEKGRALRRPHYISNMNTALQFLERRRVKLVNINAADIVDGRPAIVLGLIWTIILYFQIEEHTRLLAEQLAARSSESISSEIDGSFEPDFSGKDTRWATSTPIKQIKRPTADAVPTGAKSALLQWVRSIVTRFGIDVRDFGVSWRDGKAFLALICAIRPDVFDWSSVHLMTSRQRLFSAFDIAESDLGIPKLLDAEDVDVLNPDEKSIMTYVAQFLHRFPDPKAHARSVSVTDLEKSEYEDMTRWLSKAEETLTIAEKPSRNHEWEYEQFINLKDELEQKSKLYEKIKKRLDTNSATYVTLEMWRQLDQRWKNVQRQLKQWQWILDSNLPEQLGQIGNWVNQGEHLIESDLVPEGIFAEQDIVNILEKKLDEHNEFFANLQVVQHNLLQLSKTPLPEVPSAQLRDLTARLSRLAVTSRERQKALEYELSRHRLLSLFELVECNLAIWKRGQNSRDAIDRLLGDYQEFIVEHDFYKTMEKLFNEFNLAADIFKREGTSDSKTADGVVKSVKEITERGQELVKELIAVQRFLDECRSTWERYYVNLDALKNWLGVAKEMLGKSEDDKIDFFEDLSRWNNIFQVVNETGNFLIINSDDNVASAVRDQIENVNAEWNEVFPHVHEYLHSAEQIKNRRDYRVGLEKLRKWLVHAENILADVKNCNYTELKSSNQVFQGLHSECEEMEAHFKVISRKVQALIPELKRKDVEEIMSELKKEKETLLVVRANIPSRLYTYSQVLSHLEILDASMSEIYKWINTAEQLLSCHSLSGDKDDIESCLHRHRTYFVNCPHYASKLETANKVYEALQRSLIGTHGIDTSHLQANLDQLNKEFKLVATTAERWERQLEGALGHWNRFIESERALVQWIQTAEKLLAEKTSEIKYRREAHKNFFTTPSEHLVSELVTSAEDLQACLAQPDSYVNQTTTDLQKRWNELSSFIPVHLYTLDYLCREDALKQQLNDIETELMAEQHAYNTNSEDVHILLQRHKRFFDDSRVTSIETQLDDLAKLTNDSQTTETSYRFDAEHIQSEWNRLKKEIDNMHQLLICIPQQWQEYERRFMSMVSWMDIVDVAVAKMSSDAMTAKDFHELEATFKAISEDVDRHRENMKWLVHQLDLLVAHCTEAKATLEQQRLEGLISRYKNLLPTIETTITHVDTVSMCFLYREEVEEVSEWLKEVRKTAKKEDDVIDSLDKIQTLIDRQEQLMSKLTEYRSKVIKSLQKGRDLQSTVGAATFVGPTVDSLESQWNETYNQVMNKLKELKNVQKVWTDYEEQKNAIFALLKQAENELKKLSESVSGSEITQELKDKKNLNQHLRDTTDEMLKKLHDLSSTLTDKVDSKQKPVLEKEITEIEKQIHVVLSTVKEKIVYLEDISFKWSSYNLQLDEIKNWIEKTKAVLDTLKSSLIAPQVKEEITDRIKHDMEDKVRLLVNLESEGQDLLKSEPKTSDGNALTEQLEKIRKEIDQLKEALSQQMELIKEQVAQWNAYQAKLEEVQSWIDKAQSQMASGQPKPKTKEEGEKMKDDIKLLFDEVDEHIITITTEITDKVVEVDQSELIAALQRLKDMRETLEQWMNKIDSLTKVWEELTSKLQKIVLWLEGLEVTLKKPLKLKTSLSEDLEKQIEQLKALHRDAIEHQAETITLTQECDLLSQLLSAEATTQLRTEVGNIKYRLSQIMETIANLQSSLSDAIIQSKEFQNKILEFEVAIARLQQKIGLLDEIQSDRVENVLMSVKSLRHECVELLNNLNQIGEQVEQLKQANECTPTELSNLEDKFKKLKATYANCEKMLVAKEKHLQKWIEFVHWHNDNVEQLQWTVQQLETSKRLPEDDGSTIIEDLKNVEKNVEHYKKQIAELNTLTSESKTAIRDVSGDKICNAAEMINVVEDQIKHVKELIKAKDEQVKVLEAKNLEFQQAKSNLEQFIQGVDSQLSALRLVNISEPEIKRALSSVKSLENTISSNKPLIQDLKDKSHALICHHAATSTGGSIHVIVTECERNWDKLVATIKEKDRKLLDIQALLEEYSSSKNQLEKQLVDVEAELRTLINRKCSDGSEIKVQLEKVKNVALILHQLRSQLETNTKRRQHLIRQIPSSLIDSHHEAIAVVESDVLGERLQNLLAEANDHIRNLEAQSVLWSQIEQSDAELTAWLLNMISTFASKLDKDVTKTKLNVYKNELPEYEKMFDVLKEKAQKLFTTSENHDYLDNRLDCLNKKFDEVRESAQRLQDTLKDIAQRENEAKAKLQELMEWLNTSKSRLTKLDVTSGSDEELLQRLIECQQLEQVLVVKEAELIDLETIVKTSTVSVGGTELRMMSKELETLKKRFSHIKSECGRLISNLMALLSKRYHNLLQSLQRWLATARDKVNWCSPELTAGDSYTIEAKTLILKETLESVEQGEKIKSSYENIGNIMLKALETSEKMEKQEIKDNIDQIQQTWEQFKTQLEDITKKLGEIQVQWQDYEKLSDEINEWLREIEIEIKDETSKAQDLMEIGQRFEKGQILMEKISDCQPRFTELEAQTAIICTLNPESHVNAFTQQLCNRKNSAHKAVEDYLHKLKNLMIAEEAYDDATRKLREWLTKAEQQLRQRVTASPSVDKPMAALKNKLKILKEFMAQKTNGQVLLSDVTSSGEAILGYVSSEEREKIRTEMRQLRNQWENYWEKVNQTHKKIQVAMMQWSSFDDNCQRVTQWLQETREKLDAGVPLQPTLQEKKTQLQSLKAIQQDIQAHRSVIERLDERAHDFEEGNPEQDLAELQQDYRSLCDLIQEQLGISEHRVAVNEAYRQSLENFRDWLTVVTAELPVYSPGLNDAVLIRSSLEKLKNISEKRKVEGERLLAQIIEKNAKVIEETDEEGHSDLKADIESVRSQWEDYLQLCQSNASKFEEALDQLNLCESTIAEVNEWLRAKELLVNDQSLKNSLSVKRNHYEKLKALREEIIAYNNTIVLVSGQAQQIEELAVPKLNPVIASINSRYQALKTSIKEVLSKLELNIKDHENFDESYEDFVKWLEETENSLTKILELSGDAQTIKLKRSKLQELSDAKSSATAKLDAVVDLGERLYLQTASDGREAIRNKLQSLQERWESLGSRLADALWKLDGCIQQFDSFAFSREQLVNWLSDIQESIESHNEKRSTLQEKRVKLQGQKSVYQEIQSHRHMVDSLNEKVKHLTQQVNEPGLEESVNTIQQQYQRMENISQEVLDQLEKCIEDHQNFLDSLKNYNEWQTVADLKLLAVNDTIGEVNILQNRLETAKALSNTEKNEGLRLLNLARKAFTVAAKTSSSVGQEAMMKEIRATEDAWNAFLNRLKSVEDQLQNAVNRWGAYVTKRDEILEWLKDKEFQINSFIPQETANMKEQMLKVIKSTREEVVKYEPIIDVFVDEAHDLQKLCDAQQIKPQVSLINSRYQTLHTTSKELVTKWELIAEDHRSFDDKVREVNDWLDQLHSSLNAIISDSSDLSVDEKVQKLQTLQLEKERSSSYLTALTGMNEKIFADTSASGREQLRNEVRKVKERSEAFDAELISQTKRLETQNQQFIIYNETVQQLNTWLASIEKSLDSEKPNLNNIQELKNRLLRLKGLQQDVVFHKKLVDSIKDKLLPTSVSSDSLTKQAENIVKRYDDLSHTVKTSIQTTETAIKELQTYQDLQQQYSDWQRRMWERLGSYADFSGNKLILQGRLEKVKELHASLTEGEQKIEALADEAQLVALATFVSTHDVVDKDLMNFRNEFSKLSASIGEVLSSLSEHVRSWTNYEDSLDQLLSWLHENEEALKEFLPKETLEEKLVQLAKYQEIVSSVLKENGKFDQVCQAAEELVQLSGEARVSVTIQQVITRYQSLKIAAKEILKKCEQQAEDHRQYLEEFKRLTDWLNDMKENFEKLHSADIVQSLHKKQSDLKEILQEKPHGMSMLNCVIDLSEKVVSNTSVEGKGKIRAQMQEIRQEFDEFYDNVVNYMKDLTTQINQRSGLDQSIDNFNRWLKDVQSQLVDDIILHATLEEKKNQLQTYRTILHDIKSHQPLVSELKDCSEAFANKDLNIVETISSLVESYELVLQKATKLVDTYLQWVASHNQYSIALENAKAWLTTLKSNFAACNDVPSDRINFQGTLERLKKLQNEMVEEEFTIVKVVQLGDTVAKESSDSGREEIRHYTEAIEKEFHQIQSSITSLISSRINQLNLWKDYEKDLETCMSWIKSIDSQIHSVDLKPTLNDKLEQLQNLKSLQAVVHSKQFEIDSVIDRGQQLHSGVSGHRSSIAADIGVRYQQISTKLKETVQKWMIIVNSHQDYDSRYLECRAWMADMDKQVAYCSDVTSFSLADEEAKLEAIQELLVKKENGYSKVQQVVELAQSVLLNTSIPGHAPINQAITTLQADWSKLAHKVTEAKIHLDETANTWSEFLEQIHQLARNVERMETVLREVQSFQSTLSEKRTQVSKLNDLEQKVNSELNDAEIIRLKLAEIASREQTTPAVEQAQESLKKFDHLVQTIKVVAREREQQVKDHQLYKEACNDLVKWINNTRENIPTMTRSLGDRLALEAGVSNFEQILTKMSQGQVKVDQMMALGETTLNTTSPTGQDSIIIEMKGLQQDYENLVKDVESQKNKLVEICGLWKDYKGEYELISEWLQQMESDVKELKTALKATLEEKRQAFEQCKGLLDQLLEGQGKLDYLNKLAESLLASHLDSYVSNQQRHLNTRYQVLVNLAKDVLMKVEQNFENHREYEENTNKALAWMEEAKQMVKDCNNISADDRDTIRSRMEAIQSLLLKQDVGGSLVHNAVTWGEKAARTSRPEARAAITKQLSELQTEWDRLVNKMSNAKVSLESALLQWTDYNSSFKHLQDWLNDREKKLQQAKVETKSMALQKGLGEKRAGLRKTNSFVMDIVSFRPMIESVSTKAEELFHKSPSSKVANDASEIASQYQSLSQQAQELLDKQKQLVSQHEAYTDNSHDFQQWLKLAKEKLGKCVEACGDKDILASKLTQIDVLKKEADEVGEVKLATVLSLGTAIVGIDESEDADSIEDEFISLKAEFEEYKKSLESTKLILEKAMSNWNDYNEHLSKCSQWLEETEQSVQGYLKLQPDLNGKRQQLELFQVLLEEIFDWQKQLDLLNIRAQSLLAICSDSRISNSVTQLSTKYYALLTLAKEVMRRLEQHFQEHQQQQCMYSECVDWIEKTRERLADCQKQSYNLDELNNKLHSIKNIRTGLEQGQNRMKYLLELKEKVVMNTDVAGVAAIKENMDNLHQDFDKLSADVGNTRLSIINQIALVEDQRKKLKLFSSWLQEVEDKINSDQLGPGSSLASTELSDKKAKLEKYRAILIDVNGHIPIVDELTGFQEKGIPCSPYNEIPSMLTRYSEIGLNVRTAIEALEEAIEHLDRFQNAYQQAREWLLKTKMAVQECSDFSSDDTAASVENKLSRLNNVSDSLGDGKLLIEEVTRTGSDLFSEDSQEGSVKQNINECNEEWELINHLINSAYSILRKCLDCWKEFDQLYEQLSNWLSKFETTVAAEIALQDRSESRSIDQLDKCKCLLTEAEDHKPLLDNINEKGEALIELSGHTSIRDQDVQLMTTFMNVISTLQNQIAKIERSLKDFTEYKAVKAEFDNWYENVRRIIDENANNIEGNEKRLRQNMDSLKGINMKLSEGQHFLNSMNEAAAKAVTAVSVEQQKTIRDEIDTSQQLVNDLTVDIGRCIEQIKDLIAKLHDFSQNKAKLQKWLESVNDRMATEDSVCAGEMSEIRIRLENHKNLLEEVESHHEEMSELEKQAKELSEKISDGDFIKDMINLTSNCNAIKDQCHKIIKLLEAEINELQDYQLALHETEKWILQTSFQLMAHNSLYINSLVQTEEHLREHEETLKEIEAYQENIFNVRDKGSQLAHHYDTATTSRMKDEIQQQIKNIQSSYESLIATAQRIQKRLQESLRKFQEYEEALRLINESLDKLEVDMNKEKDADSSKTVEEARNHQNIIRNILNQLNLEKQRLQSAIQCCEDATASLSRPSSPEGGLQSFANEKELQTKLRLEDNIDQAEGMLSTITKIVNEWEELERRREELRKWIKEREAQLVELRSKPFKLRSEAAQGEILKLQELKARVEEKKMDIDDIENRQATLAPCSEDQAVRELLEQLESQVNQHIDSQSHVRQQVEDYKNLLNKLLNWFDNLLKRLEFIEKGGEGLDNKQKTDKVKEIAEELDITKSLMEELHSRSTDIIPELSGLDVQQVEEQVKSADKKFAEVQRRTARQMQLLEAQALEIQDASIEMANLQKWIDEKMDEIDKRKSKPTGYKSEQIEESIKDTENLQSEAKAKEFLVDNINKQVDRVFSQMQGASERDQMQNRAVQLKDSHSKLCNAIDRLIEELNKALGDRKQFELSLEAVQRWLDERIQTLIDKVETYPLKATEIEKKIESYKRFLSEVEHFEDNQVDDIKKRAGHLSRDCCDDQERNELAKSVEQLNETLSKLKDKINEAIDVFDAELQARKELESKLEQCQQWLDMADIVLANDVRPLSATTEALENNLKKFQELLQESENITDTLNEILSEAGEVQEKIDEAEKLILQCDLNSLKDRFSRDIKSIIDKLSQLENLLLSRKQYELELQEKAELLKKVEDEIKSLNQPVGPTVEDATKHLDNCQALLKKIQDIRDALDTLCNLSTAATSDSEALLDQLNQFLQAVETQINKLKQMIFLRQQFETVLTEIILTLTKYNDLVASIENADSMGIDDKIKKYQDILSSLAACEANLTSATDKGRRIAGEGTMSDSNAINEQLHSLKDQLTSLKRLVEQRKAEHEEIAEELNRLVQAMDAKIDWLHNNQTAVKTRPLLEVEVDSTIEELNKCNLLESEMSNNLKEVTDLQDKLEQDYDFDTLPATIQDRVSEAKVLQQTLPNDLEDLRNYLLTARQLREDYFAAVSRLTAWLNEAEERLKHCDDEVHYEYIAEELDQHKEFFGNGEERLEIMENILNLGEKIIPTLVPEAKQSLIKHQDNLQARLRKCNHLASRRESQLEGCLKDWYEFQELLSRADDILSKFDAITKLVSTQAELHSHLYLINSQQTQVQEGQSVIDSLNEQGRKLCRRANQDSQILINQQVGAINERWRVLQDKSETDKLFLEDVLRQWKEFAQLLKTLSSSLSLIEQSVELTEGSGIRSRKHVEEILNKLKEVNEKLSEHLPQLNNAIKAAEELKQHKQLLSNTAIESVSKEVDDVQNKFERLRNTLEDRIRWAEKEVDHLEGVEKDIHRLQQAFKNIQGEIERLDVYDPDEESVESTIKRLENDVTELDQQTKTLITNEHQRHRLANATLPSEIGQQLSALELLSDSVKAAMDEKSREGKKAKTMRYDFTSDVEFVQSWLQQAEAKVQDRLEKAENLKQYIQKYLSEWDSIEERMRKINHDGLVLIQRTVNLEEQNLIKNTIASLSDQMFQVKSVIEDRKEQVNQALESKANFNQIYNGLKNWIEKTKGFLSLQLTYPNIATVRQRLSEYQGVQRECLQNQKSLSELAKDLEKILQICSPEDLPTRLAEIDQEMQDVEAQVNKKVALLAELCEEWEQCDRKMKETSVWMEKTKQNIESPHNRKKSLRDQLILREVS
ncbi:hypothetical protein CHUAL_003173 [Chamberlinius hualienensis]